MGSAFPDRCDQAAVAAIVSGINPNRDSSELFRNPHHPPTPFDEFHLGGKIAFDGCVDILLDCTAVGSCSSNEYIDTSRVETEPWVTRVRRT